MAIKWKEGLVMEKTCYIQEKHKKEEHKYFFCIPERIIKEFTVIEALAIGEIPHFNSSYLKELITLIALYQRKDERQARLKSTYLNKLIPHYQGYVRFLIELGVIRRSGPYIPGHVSYNYAFTHEYLSRYKYFPIKDMFLVKRIQRSCLNRHNTRQYPGQAKFIRKMTIEPEALQYIKDFEIDQYNAALSSILKIMHGPIGIFYSVDSTSGRFHSNLTNLPEPLRQFIRINGLPLANIDIKNSQPYLSTLLLTNPGKVSSFAKTKELSMLLQSLEKIDSMDVTMFNYLVNKGRLYEFLIEKGFTPDRKRAKRQLFVVIFGPAKYWSKQHEIFEKWFPEVYERFIIIKGHTRGNKFQCYKRLAILLQSVEAHLVLDTILPMVYKKYPGTIAVTIHDSVMTSLLTTDVEAVKSIMEEELTRFVGMPPTLKIEKIDLLTPVYQY